MDAEYKLIEGDCLATLPTLPAASVQCCVTSPPYFGLRDYGVSGQIGLEPTIGEYVAKMTAVFREVWRVLKPDGVLFLNLGDSYATDQKGGIKSKEGDKSFTNKGGLGIDRISYSGVSASINNFLAQSIKEGVIFLSAGCSLTVAAKRDGVLKHDKFTPNQEFTSLFGVKRIFIKDRNNNLCQVFDSFASIGCVWISRAVAWVAVGQTNTDIILDMVDNLGIVISDHNLNTNPALEIPIGARAAEYSKATFPIKEAAEPVAELIGDAQSVGNALLHPLGESIAEIDAVNKSVSLADAFLFGSSHLGDFRITKSSEKQFSLSLMGGQCQIAALSVAHVFVSNRLGSFIHYAELYDKAERNANTMRSKQLIGVPWLVARALQEDGWILRSDCIWHKPNPMPESVTDRPTRSHEYIFLFAKQGRYYYNAEAIREPAAYPDDDRKARAKPDNKEFQDARHARMNPHPDKQRGHGRRHDGFNDRWDNMTRDEQCAGMRNKRDVWTVAPSQFAEAHFATFPPDLIEPCILAGSAPGDTVLDPFSGSGTTAAVALKHHRNAIGLELNKAYIEMAHKRIDRTQYVLPLEVSK